MDSTPSDGNDVPDGEAHEATFEGRLGVGFIGQLRRWSYLFLRPRVMVRVGVALVVIGLTVVFLELSDITALAIFGECLLAAGALLLARGVVAQRM